MTIEQLLHTQWGADHELQSALPAARLFTGGARGEPALPYAVLERASEVAGIRTSSGTLLRREKLAFHVYAESLERGRAVTAAIERRFARGDLTADDEVAIDLRRAARRETLQADDVWRVTLEFDVLLRTLER